MSQTSTYVADKPKKQHDLRKASLLRMAKDARKRAKNYQSGNGLIIAQALGVFAEVLRTEAEKKLR